MQSDRRWCSDSSSLTNLIQWDTAMGIKVRLAALATLAAAFAGVAPTLSALNGNVGSQHSRGDIAVPNAEEQVGKKNEAEVKIAALKGAELNRQKQDEARIAPQASQLQFLYTYYIWMEVCAERFNEFRDTKARLRQILRSKEVDFTLEQADSIWNVAAEKFQQVEGVLQISGDDQLYTNCDQNSRYVEGFLMLASRMGGPTSPLPRKKDF
jgi:hypothetical protein